MSDMRSCIKTACRWPAAATLAYRYATAEVWLSDLGDPHPATHDLCPHHADTLKVPRGWTLVDDRQPVEAVHEPSADEIVQRVATLRRSVDAMLEQPVVQTRRSRYESLLDSLPTYDRPEEPALDDAADGAEDDAADHRSPVLVQVGVSHEMAPIARERYVDLAASRRVLPDRPGAAGADAGTADRGPADPDAVHETGLKGAVVLSLPLRHHDADRDGSGDDADGAG